MTCLLVCRIEAANQRNGRRSRWRQQIRWLRSRTEYRKSWFWAICTRIYWQMKRHSFSIRWERISNRTSWRWDRLIRRLWLMSRPKRLNPMPRRDKSIMITFRKSWSGIKSEEWVTRYKGSQEASVASGQRNEECPRGKSWSPRNTQKVWYQCINKYKEV